MSSNFLSGLSEYLEAFDGRAEDFLFYYDLDNSGRFARCHWPTQEAWRVIDSQVMILACAKNRVTV